MFKKYIGLRTIKTGIAIWLCILVTAAIRLDSAFYAAIAVIVSMDKTIIGSFKTGRNRMVGTLVGALTGLVFASVMPENALMCGIGIIILITVCNMMQVKGSIVVGGIVFLAIMVNLKDQSALVYSARRIIETFIGIVIAIVVNFLFFPFDGLAYIEKDLKDIIKDVASHINECIIGKEKNNVFKMYDKITELEREFDAYKVDIHAKKRIDAIAALYTDIACVKSLYMHLEILGELPGYPLISAVNLKKLGELGIINCLDCKENIIKNNSEEDIVYNYHLKRLFELYECINNKYFGK
ncbi:MAG: hypothetical protein K0S71_98 [Clostridia bacterium]|jgi:uncharacterized membrane protein YgaE (UPF0421/DUF939 family)|nr:hypothetical protein [Clostridia bacterium]